MRDFTGGIVETCVVEKTSHYLFTIFRDLIVKSSMMSCTTIKQTNNKDEIINFGLMPSHAYAITGVKIIKGKYLDKEFKLIRIRNPHGQDIENPYHGFIRNVIPEESINSELKIKVPGESWILFDDFVKFFEFIDICNLTPNPIIGDVYDKDAQKKLSLSTINGKWMGGINIKEAKYDDMFEFFPQYRILTTNPDEGKKTCDVLIGLTIKDRQDALPAGKTPFFFQIMKVSYLS